MTELGDEQKRDFEAAAFRRLVEHLSERSDVQNIDLMNLAGFCRNCLSNWYREAAEAQGVTLSKEESRKSSTACPMPSGRRCTRPRHPRPSSRPSKSAGRRTIETRPALAQALRRLPP